jgi:regulator of RNase E activity RraA
MFLHSSLGNARGKACQSTNDISYAEVTFVPPLFVNGSDGGFRREQMEQTKMNLWKTDDDLFSLARQELFTCVVGDVMDKLELYHQFLPPQIQPLRQDMVVIGRAMPALAVDVFAERIAGTANPLMQKPFGLMLEALDDLHPGEVYVGTGSSARNALWGELMSIRARRLGSNGAVLNGYVRDTRAVLSMGFPTFSWGSYGQDSSPRYKVVDFRVPVEIGCVRMQPGDILFGDIDGVCVVPAEAVADVFVKALEKVRGERKVRKALEEGSSAVAAFEEYGIM